MSRPGPSQSIKIKGSSGVSFGNVTQSLGGDTVGGSEPPVVVLFLAANPAATSRLRLDREVRAIDDALRASGAREHFALEQLWAASDADLQEGLLRWHPAVVHISGHGSAAGRLVLEPDLLARDIAASPLGPGAVERDSASAALRATASLFGAVSASTRCLLLNACHSAAQAEAAAPRVGCAIGMAGAIDDGAAICFARVFYGAVGYGLSLGAAFGLACAQGVLADAGSEGVPRLFTSFPAAADLVLVRRD